MCQNLVDLLIGRMAEWQTEFFNPVGQSPQNGNKRYGVTCKSFFFSECLYQKKLLHAFCNMVMEYKNIVGQAPTLFLNPGA
jgi:hypothetical protein